MLTFFGIEEHADTGSNNLCFIKDFIKRIVQNVCLNIISNLKIIYSRTTKH